MLSRMLLSLKNGWYDKEKRVYIYFTIKEAMDKLNIAREKCIKVFAELDSEKGCGLITKVRQGLGKPDIIYVMKYSSCGIPEDGDDDTNCNYEDEIEQVSVKDMPNEENSRNSKTETPEVRKSKHQKFENRKQIIMILIIIKIIILILVISIISHHINKKKHPKKEM